MENSKSLYDLMLVSRTATVSTLIDTLIPGSTAQTVHGIRACLGGFKRRDHHRSKSRLIQEEIGSPRLSRATKQSFRHDLDRAVLFPRGHRLAKTEVAKAERSRRWTEFDVVSPWQTHLSPSKDVIQTSAMPPAAKAHGSAVWETLAPLGLDTTCPVEKA
ncbi:hypothetical protein NDU88_001893 [Pleurodeles waltl]|uniref:Uncharacterized protein n=1 Tax=Pleurodeles waltl TaxID=8319 RepID=A0AAV7MM86_PLEWA|nr:hypothetical protein NDU88_001893 [Pleurodeles waltl]